jgi:hypothetical protein
MVLRCSQWVELCMDKHINDTGGLLCAGVSWASACLGPGKHIHARTHVWPRPHTHTHTHTVREREREGEGGASERSCNPFHHASLWGASPCHLQRSLTRIHYDCTQADMRPKGQWSDSVNAHLLMFGQLRSKVTGFRSKIRRFADVASFLQGD